MTKSEQITSDFLLLSKQSEGVVKMQDLATLCAGHYSITRDEVEQWVAKQVFLKNIGSQYVGANYYIINLKK